MSAVESEGEGGGGRRIKAVIYNNQKKVDMFVDTRDARGRAVIYIFGNFPTGKGGEVQLQSNPFVLNGRCGQNF